MALLKKCLRQESRSPPEQLLILVAELVGGEGGGSSNAGPFKIHLFFGVSGGWGMAPFWWATMTREEGDEHSSWRGRYFRPG